MTKKHEELVEEIADYLQAAYAMGQHDYKLGIGYGETPRKWDRDRAKKIIAAILSAFHDGRLDEELGVIARIDLWDGAEVGGEVIPSGGHTLIALPREKPGE